MSVEFQSWGRNKHSRVKAVLAPCWRDEDLNLHEQQTGLLPYGNGRSYGDSCLNDDGTMILSRSLNHFISFNPAEARLRCECGVLLSEILELIVPHGFFLAVSPGTTFITVGGAIANDVHGKNHHVAGTFGCHVECFEVLRSDGSRTLCSASQNVELFNATIGGLGLTGFILWAEIRLQRIPSCFIEQEITRFKHIDEYLEHSRENDAKFEYAVSWVDCTASAASLGRGVFSGGNFANTEVGQNLRYTEASSVSLPLDLPGFVMSGVGVKLFNRLYYAWQGRRNARSTTHYYPFFYPLDRIQHWNRAYGSRGFFQYQFVVSFDAASTVLPQVLSSTVAHGKASFVTVLKNFGRKTSPGMMSFPREGVTLALDFRNEGESTLRLMRELDAIIDAHEGRLYAAKDARMSSSHFMRAYPQWSEFSKYIDPRFSSSFWRRVTQE